MVDAFHGALTEVGEILADHSGLDLTALHAHAYVRYSEAAVEHLFAVASGLDSMVIGEQQILGQIRSAYASSDAQQAAGRVVHELAQQALRVGKRSAFRNRNRLRRSISRVRGSRSCSGHHR